METLTLEQAYFIGELIAAFGVIVSLLYLGRQMKQNTEANQVNAAQVFVDMFNTFTASLGSSDDMADIWYRGTSDYQSLNVQETIRFNALAHQWFRIIESAYQQWKRGAVDKDFWAGLSNCAIDTYSTPGLSTYSKIRQHWHGPEFINWLESTKQNQGSKDLYGFLEQK